MELCVLAGSAAPLLYPAMAKYSMGRTQNNICKTHAMGSGMRMESVGTDFSAESVASPRRCG